MTSDFDAFMNAGIAEAVQVIGTKTFTIGGTTYRNAGILSQYTSARELELGGFAGVFDATLLCPRTKFTETNGVALERSLDGKLVVIDSRTFKIARTEMDESSVTLGLVHHK
jgi:hypothetical protein